MPAKQHDLIFQKNNQDFLYETIIYQDDSVLPFDFTGYTARLEIKNKLSSGFFKNPAILILTTENGGITLGGTTGTLDLFVSKDVLKYKASFDAFYDLILIDTLGITTRILEGRACCDNYESVTKQTIVTASLFPRGIAWDNVMVIGTNLNNLCRAMSEMVVDLKAEILRFYKEIFFTTHTSLTNDLRLAEYGLPNACDPNSLTLGLIENGIDKTKTRVEIIEDALTYIGINADVIDEIVNDIPKTLSIVINSDSDIFNGCLQPIGSASCNIYTGDASCESIMYAGASPYKFLPNLECVFKQVVPLGWVVNFYLDTKQAKLFTGN